jgi:hypothetical protein
MGQLPSKQLCPLCGLDDEVKVVVIRDGWFFVCTRTSKHAQPYKWTSSDLAPSEDDDAEPGVMESLGLFDDLPHCLGKDEAFVEYGIAEHRHRVMRPYTFGQLLATYGHRAIEIGRPYATSSFLASALRILANRGELELRWGPATGFWSYDGTVSYWALTPASEDSMRSWASYCADEGLDANDLGIA